jgi:hypothetical protein
MLKLRPVAAFCLALCAGTLRAAPDARALNASVVHVKTDESDGTGFVVGADEKTVFIVTAKHVVANGAPGLRVQFHGKQYQSLAGRMFRRSGEVDLAIVLVDVAADDSIRRSLKPLAYRTGRVAMLTTVSNVAIADDRWFSNFEVNKLQADELNVLGFSKSGVTHGASGGPLFDNGYRLIGMVTEVDGVKATALKIDEILARLSDWGVPVNLLEVWRPDCKVAIASVPEAAIVTADGTEIGATPLSVPVPVDKGIAVTLEKAGYKRETRQIDCASSSVVVTLMAASRVTFVYGGMFPDSEKEVEITIGGVAFHPTGNRYVATGVPAGAVDYAVGGTMVTPSGPCNVTGNGNLTLKDGDVIEILWDRRTRVSCGVLLRHQVSDMSTPARHQPQSSSPPKTAIIDERGHSVTALLLVAQRIEARGYSTDGKLSEDMEQSKETAGMITVHMSLDVTVRGAGGKIAAAFVVTSRGGGFREDAARIQALERLAAAFEKRLAQEVP